MDIIVCIARFVYKTVGTTSIIDVRCFRQALGCFVECRGICHSICFLRFCGRGGTWKRAKMEDGPFFVFLASPGIFVWRERGRGVLLIKNLSRL